MALVALECRPFLVETYFHLSEYFSRFRIDSRRFHDWIFIIVNATLKDVSKTLRERRRELGVSQADLARLSGLSLHGVSDIETGKGNPTLETLLKLVEVLGLGILLKPTKPESFTKSASGGEES